MSYAIFQRLTKLMGIILVCFICYDMANSQDFPAVYIGDAGGQPFPVPYSGKVTIPVWVSGPYSYNINLVLGTYNFYVSDRSGGNFYLEGEYEFGEPEIHEYSTWQALACYPTNWGWGQFRFADFNFNMDLTPQHIGRTLSVMTVPAAIFYIEGWGFMFADTYISQLLITPISSIDAEDENHEKMLLLDSYPNPFNSSTTIRFSLREVADVAIEIYDISGREVRSLFLPDCRSGENHVIWDGRDNTGDPISSGFYLYRISCGNSSYFSRVTLLK